MEFGIIRFWYHVAVELWFIVVLGVPEGALSDRLTLVGLGKKIYREHFIFLLK